MMELRIFQQGRNDTDTSELLFEPGDHINIITKKRNTRLTAVPKTAGCRGCYFKAVCYAGPYETFLHVQCGIHCRKIIFVKL